MSLRARLLLALGAVAVAALAVADVAIYSALRTSLFNGVDQQLAQAAAHFSGPGQQYQLPCGDNGPPGPPSVVTSYFVAVVPDGSPASDNECLAYLDDHRYSPVLPATFSGFTAGPDGSQVTSFSAPATVGGGPDFEVRVAKLPDGTEVIVAAPITTTEDTLHRLALIELGVSAVAVVAALLAGWWLVRLGLRPLTEVERTAENIAAGDLRRRVPDENDRTEVGRLAKTLNVMLGRIETAFRARIASEERLKASDRRLRQFVGDASHELRTPLAAVSAYAELFERGAADNPEDLARAMAGIRAETQRMDRLVADLLTLARLDEGQPVERVPVELVTLCAEAAQTARTVSADWPITLSAARPVEVEGDPHRLRQVLDNLLGNVRAHTPPGTPTEIVVASDGLHAVVTVSDRGPGLPEDEAPRVFERFYRSDPSRSRHHGGSGLGLSIVAAVVQAHGGWVEADSAPGEGMAVTIRLPLVPEAPAEPPILEEAASDAGAGPPEAMAAPADRTLGSP